MANNLVPQQRAWNPANGRWICTPELPMPKGAEGRWEHEVVEEIGDSEDGWPGGDIQRFRCKNCGHEWEEELPQ